MTIKCTLLRLEESFAIPPSRDSDDKRLLRLHVYVQDRFERRINVSH